MLRRGRIGGSFADDEVSRVRTTLWREPPRSGRVSEFLAAAKRLVGSSQRSWDVGSVLMKLPRGPVSVVFTVSCRIRIRTSARFAICRLQAFRTPGEILDRCLRQARLYGAASARC